MCARCFALVSLMGGLYMISDKPETYDDTHLEMICRTLPPLTTCAAETGPVDYTTPACIYTRGGGEELCHDISHIDDSVAPFSSLWAFHMVHGGRSWCVVQRCAVVPLDAMVISADKLGLDPTRELLYVQLLGTARFTRAAAGRLPSPSWRWAKPPCWR